MYYPLQFFTLMQVAASIVSVLAKLRLVLPLEWVINICLAVGAIALFLWGYWFWTNSGAIHCKFGLLAIIIGSLLGVWL